MQKVHINMNFNNNLIAIEYKKIINRSVDLQLLG